MIDDRILGIQVIITILVNFPSRPRNLPFFVETFPPLGIRDDLEWAWAAK